jgi:hypothetical protein
MLARLSIDRRQGLYKILPTAKSLSPYRLVGPLQIGTVRATPSKSACPREPRKLRNVLSQFNHNTSTYGTIVIPPLAFV